MMFRPGTLDEWARFLDARSDDEAAGEVAVHTARLNALYDELCSCIVPLWNEPSNQVVEDLMVARTGIAESVAVLDAVKARFNSGEREIA
jgi:hypothetical protein